MGHNDGASFENISSGGSAELLQSIDRARGDAAIPTLSTTIQESTTGLLEGADEDSNNGEVFQNKAMELVKLGDYYSSIGEKDTAIRYFDEALVLGANDVLVLFLIGSTYIIDENFEKACEALSLALARDPENPEIKVDLAYATRKLSQNKN